MRRRLKPFLKLAEVACGVRAAFQLDHYLPILFSSIRPENPVMALEMKAFLDRGLIGGLFLAFMADPDDGVSELICKTVVYASAIVTAVLLAISPMCTKAFVWKGLRWRIPAIATWSLSFTLSSFICMRKGLSPQRGVCFAYASTLLASILYELGWTFPRYGILAIVAMPKFFLSLFIVILTFLWGFDWRLLTLAISAILLESLLYNKFDAILFSLSRWSAPIILRVPGLLFAVASSLSLNPLPPSFSDDAPVRSLISSLIKIASTYTVIFLVFRSLFSLGFYTVAFSFMEDVAPSIRLFVLSVFGYRACRSAFKISCSNCYQVLDDRIMRPFGCVVTSGILYLLLSPYFYYMKPFGFWVQLLILLFFVISVLTLVLRLRSAGFCLNPVSWWRKLMKIYEEVVGN